MAGGVMVGIDGGGTHTRAIAFSEAGEVVGRGEGGPSNWQVAGVEFAVESVRAAVAAATGGTQIQGVGACLAGIDLPEDLERLRGPLEARLGCAVAVENDITAAAYAAASVPCGVISAGTGAAVAMRDDSGVRRLLALNAYTGPEGGAGDIVAAALQAMCLAAQGAAPETELLPRVLQALGLRDHIELARMTEQGEAESWRIGLVVSPLVSEVAAQGDPVATRILRACGGGLGRTAGRFLHSAGLPTGSRIYLYGSLLQGGPKDYGKALRRGLGREIPGVRVVMGDAPALLGAALFAAEQFGWAAAALRSSFRRVLDAGA